MTGTADFDCLNCGACCRNTRPDTILVPEADLVRWRATGRHDLAEQTVIGHFSERAFATRPCGARGFACVHLGTAENPNACAIYTERGTTCREFEAGSAQCLAARAAGQL
ncbi:MAG TPA: YkgJ family cysteine cluster protein [Polyangiaceae bacterium]|nr:YkgJ family cysteine cluster protein [Polyangiaceae bacterium]